MSETWKPLMLSGTVGLQGTSTYNEMTIDSKRRYVRIQRLIIVPANDGSAVTYAPLVTNGDGVSGSIGQYYAGASTSIGDNFDVTDIQGWAVTDASGKLWIAFVPSAGSDNTFSYELYLEVF